VIDHAYMSTAVTIVGSHVKLCARLLILILLKKDLTKVLLLIVKWQGIL